MIILALWFILLKCLIYMKFPFLFQPTKMIWVKSTLKSCYSFLCSDQNTYWAPCLWLVIKNRYKHHALISELVDLLENEIQISDPRCLQKSEFAGLKDSSLMRACTLLHLSPWFQTPTPHVNIKRELHKWQISTLMSLFYVWLHLSL